MKNILIVGLGLIGGSLALAIKKGQPDVVIYGWDHDPKTCQIALDKAIVDRVPTDFASGALAADVILLAVPVKTAMTYLERLGQLQLKDQVIVTDASSTKLEIATAAEKLPFTFVGGHPMAGSHKSGVLAADGDLFEEAYYIFTSEDQKAVDQLQELLRGTRAKYVQLTPTEHDQITGMLSHLPHIIAAALVNQADGFNQLHPRARQLAAGGFRDITRIASSDPQMWTDILLSNRETLLSLIHNWQNQMDQVTDWLTTADQSAIHSFFDNAKDTRDRLPVHQNGAIPAFYDLFVDVPDQPGVVAEVMTLLGDAGISIVNLKIQETREDIIGVLQITFKNQRDLEAAKACIETQTTFSCRIK